MRKIKRLWRFSQKPLLSLIVISTAYLVALNGCVPPVRATFLNDACIKPYKAYTYHTCDTIFFMVDGHTHVIPKTFETDLASIPRIAWPFMSPAFSPIIKASIVHDFLYRGSCIFDRKKSDAIFYHLLINEGLSKVESKILYMAVRLGGHNAYKDCHARAHQKDDKKRGGAAPFPLR